MSRMRNARLLTRLRLLLHGQMDNIRLRALGCRPVTGHPGCYPGKPVSPVKKNWVASDRFIPRKFVRPALHLMHRSAASGIVLVVAAVIAMLWANLPAFGDSYQNFWKHAYLDLSLGPIHLHESLQHLVNDGLMTIFFLVVGLEIKREMVLGELRDPRKAVLPVVAALGGMVLPALIYVAFNLDNQVALRGWGVPMATDIAFSLGILALVGSRAPVGVRLFLLAVAIADDVGAIAVIAIFYTSDLNFGYLLLGGAVLVAIGVASRVHIRSYVFYVPMGVIAWYAFLESGVHPTIAGVLLGFLTPARPLYDGAEFGRATRQIIDVYDTHPADSAGTYAPGPTEAHFEEVIEYEARAEFAGRVSEVARESIPPLTRVEHKLHDWSAFVIIPIFALANAGVTFTGVDIVDALTTPVALGVALGLVIGKGLGVTGFAWVVVKLGWGRLPKGVGWAHLTGIGLLAGVGFTVAIFITELAFTDPVLGDLAKIGIFAGSIVAGVLGYLKLRLASPTEVDPQS